MAKEHTKIECSARIMSELEEHCFSETQIEVGGFLVGRVEEERTIVTAALPAHHSVGGSTQLTFTHDSWTTVHEQISNMEEGNQLIGWYHSHPNFGVFLSDYDQFIQTNFFKQDGQVTIVIDPIRGRRGWFYSWNGKIEEYGKESDTTRPKLGKSSTNADENMEAVMGTQNANGVSLKKVVSISAMMSFTSFVLGIVVSTITLGNTSDVQQQINDLQFRLTQLQIESGINLPNSGSAVKDSVTKTTSEPSQAGPSQNSTTGSKATAAKKAAPPKLGGKCALEKSVAPDATGIKLVCTKGKNGALTWQRTGKGLSSEPVAPVGNTTPSADKKAPAGVGSAELETATVKQG